jgi:hypothetical protein
MRHLPHIARLTKGLRILAQIQSAAHNWDDVIKNEVLRLGAPSASVRFPNLPLQGREVSTVSLFFSRLFGSRVVTEHDIAVVAPSPVQSFRNFGLRLGGMFVALRRASLSGRSGSLIGRIDLGNSLRGMFFSPKGIICATHAGALTLAFSASFANAADYVGSPPIKLVATNDAVKGLTSSYVWHWLPNDNWVNSGNNPRVSVENSEVNPEPSRICSDFIVRDAEGVTTRGCGNNNAPTSAQPERDDIVWTAR